MNFNRFTVNINHIRKCLEGEKRNANGKSDWQAADPGMKQTIGDGDPEIQVFIEKENSKVQDDIRNQKFFRLTPESVDQQSEAVIQYNGKRHNEDKFWLSISIKAQTCRKQNVIPVFFFCKVI